MGESARHEKLQVIVGGQLNGHVLAVSGGAAPYVDRHIKNGAFDASDEFCLGERGPLEVQSAHYSA